mmetsp:Transcript_48803/g.145829  ORF Transcript_48803/g.145829 Transcript_48803/m.145829 type:complete len:211 (+) Transcript_48803:95-727(+)
MPDPPSTSSAAASRRPSRPLDASASNVPGRSLGVLGEAPGREATSSTCAFGAHLRRESPTATSWDAASASLSGSEALTKKARTRTFRLLRTNCGQKARIFSEPPTSQRSKSTRQPSSSSGMALRMIRAAPTVGGKRPPGRHSSPGFSHSHRKADFPAPSRPNSKTCRMPLDGSNAAAATGSVWFAPLLPSSFRGASSRLQSRQGNTQQTT